MTTTIDTRLTRLEAASVAAVLKDEPITLSDEERLSLVSGLLALYELRCETHGIPEDPPEGSDDWRAQRVLAILDGARARRDALEVADADA